jgi:hypothetical protein
MSDPIQQVEVYQQGRVLKRVACEGVAAASSVLSRNCHRCCQSVKREPLPAGLLRRRLDADGYETDVGRVLDDDSR